MSDTSESDVRGDLIPDHIVGANQPEAIRDNVSTIRGINTTIPPNFSYLVLHEA